MKKIVMTAALVACAAVVTAQTVTSANIVGYSKKDVASAAFSIVSPQFYGAETGTALGAAFGTVPDQTVVYVWIGTGYTEYTFYLEDGLGGNWYDQGFANANDVVLGQGDAVWLKAGVAAATPIMAGEVPSAASVTQPVAAGFNLIANPYPVALALNDLDLNGISDQDVVYAWNGTGYTEYTYYAEDGLGGNWYDQGFSNAGGVTIPVGDGIWLKSASAGNLVFNKMY